MAGPLAGHIALHIARHACCLGYSSRCGAGLLNECYNARHEVFDEGFSHAESGGPLECSYGDKEG